MDWLRLVLERSTKFGDALPPGHQEQRRTKQTAYADREHEWVRPDASANHCSSLARVEQVVRSGGTVLVVVGLVVGNIELGAYDGRQTVHAVQ